MIKVFRTRSTVYLSINLFIMELYFDFGMRIPHKIESIIRFYLRPLRSFDQSIRYAFNRNAVPDYYRTTSLPKSFIFSSYNYFYGWRLDGRVSNPVGLRD